MAETEEIKKSNEVIDIDVKYLDVIPPIHIIKSMDEVGQFYLLLGLTDQRWSKEEK